MTYYVDNIDLSSELTEKYFIYAIFINLGIIHYFDACVYLVCFLSYVIFRESIHKFEHFNYQIIALILVSIMELKYQKD